MLTYMSASTSSPAQGAMYAPLALKFVDNMRPFRCLTCHFRAPVLQITVNPKATGTSPKSQLNSHAGAIAGGTIGGVSVFLAIGAIALVVRCRRERIRRRQSIGSSFQTVGPASNWPTTLTPFNQTHFEVSGLETDTRMDSQQHWAGHFRPESITLIQAPPLSSPVSSPHVVSFPIGLSGKELARLRAGNSRSQSNDPWSSGSTLAATTELSGVTSLEAQRPQSEAPPDYEDRGP